MVQRAAILIHGSTCSIHSSIDIITCVQYSFWLS